jgi:dihydrodipicolinate synthase/N-acetylneuraminate lyase
MPIARLISSGFGVPGLKSALTLAGVDVGLPRPPLAPAPEPAIAALKEALATFQEVTA